jgi:hypothetical protein
MPEFYTWLHEFVGKALNAHWGRWENFWAPEPTSCVRLVGAADALAKTVYALVNPVAAGLVSHGDQWPGVRLYTPGRRRIERPPGFFRDNGPTPDVATLTLTPPPIGAASTHEALARITEAVAASESKIRATFKSEGRSFLGVRGVLAQRPTDTPRSQEPRRALSPRIACRNQWLRIETLRRCKKFIADYKEAWRRWCAAIRDVVFPPGTYAMRRRHGVAIAPS